MDSTDEPQRPDTNPAPQSPSFLDELDRAIASVDALTAAIREKLEQADTATASASDGEAPADTSFPGAGWNHMFLLVFLNYLRAGVLESGEYEPEQGEFLVTAGRIFRAHGWEARHYEALSVAAEEVVRNQFGYSKEVGDLIVFTCSMLGYGANSADPIADASPRRSRRNSSDESKPAIASSVPGVIIETERRSARIVVIRLQLAAPLPWTTGQRVLVTPAFIPVPGADSSASSVSNVSSNDDAAPAARTWLSAAPAIPSNPDGIVELHVQATAQSTVSSSIVDNCEVGDWLLLDHPQGSLALTTDAPVVMIAESVGLAPLRALILDQALAETQNPIHLFYGARNPGEFYDWQTIEALAEAFPWLTTTAVSREATIPSDTRPRESVPGAPGVMGPAGTREGWVLGQATAAAIEDLLAHQQAGGTEPILLISGPGRWVEATRSALVTTGVVASPEEVQALTVGSVVTRQKPTR